MITIHAVRRLAFLLAAFATVLAISSCQPLDGADPLDQDSFSHEPLQVVPGEF